MSFTEKGAIKNGSRNPSTNNGSKSSSLENSLELTPPSSVYKDNGRSKYDPLYPEVEELLGSNPAPPPQCTLVWRELSVHITLRNGKLKRLVNNVSGIAKPGTLVALMGPSGAGKTTLMSALAHRSPVGTVVDGEIAMNGIPIDDFMHRETGYMHQDDLFVENLTVIEHLSIMARLRMDRRTSTLSRKRRVNQLLRQLSLYRSRYTRIGGLDGRKTLSGGERKRLAFATELLTDPGLLFCDEPTTGLDSSSAQQLMTLLQGSAAQGKTVICTIHQPSSELVALFDRLVLLAEGRVAFAGNGAGALNFFESLGYHCPLTYNPTDFFIKVLALTPGSEAASKTAIKSVCDRFAVSDAAKELDMEIQLEFHLMDHEDRDAKKLSFNSFKPPFFFTKIMWLVYRYGLVVIRDPRVQLIRIFQKLAIALTAGLCFLGTARLTQAGIQDVQGALFIIIAENTFSPMYSVLHMFPEEFPLFHRELRAGLYSTPIYYVARMIALFPGLIIEPSLFTLVVYWIAGLRSTVYAFGFTVFVAILVLNVAIACGSFFSCAFGSMPVAIAYLVPFDYSLMVTSGIFIKLSSIPKYVSWIRYLSWLMYSNEAMSIVQWEGVQNISPNMSGHLVTKYVKLTETIAVPEEWPVTGLQKFLIPLIEEVIKKSHAGKSVVLQILNQPAMLVQRQNRNGMQYFFDKVFTEELMGSYVIDVIFDANDRNMHTMKRSLEDYTVKVCQSEYRTAYYLIPVAQSVPIKIQNQDQLKKLCEKFGFYFKTNIDLIFLLAAMGITPLVFLIFLMETY